ncbi:thiamine-monophosphate kinase [Desulfovibrio sp. X2]|uniref:thiamine-phosphate kinase n=1 Tax=Desulfovibrio sp. X2 TaxID=941449 RepID=UPI0003589C62|nr:thiamine-phosphate kinase [Desulfovibrio sp. X2]EPR39826.1 thiamine-monophosphate kinase [Desulfovibrio sp. X2]
MSRLSSEQAFLDLIAEHFPNAHPNLELGRGDDCALLKCPPRVCLTTDLFLEDRHFRRAYFAPEDVGRKALAVNVSDILGMGARPLGFALNLMAPPDVEREWWSRMFLAMSGLAREYDLPLAGGDLSLDERIGLAVTVWGEPWPGGEFKRRGMAEAGDTLFAVGHLGLARAGLLALEEKGRHAQADFPHAVACHLCPCLSPKASNTLSRLPFVRGLMDVSDGLAQDVPRFVGPRLGAALDLDPAVLHEEVRIAAGAHGQDPALFAALGGEDYALLGALPPDRLAEARDRVPELVPIGTVTPEPGLTLHGAPLGRGFDHFQKD